MLSFFRVFCVFFSLVVGFCCGWTPSTKHSHSAFENTLCHLISFSRYPNEIPEPSDAICLQVKKKPWFPSPGRREKDEKISNFLEHFQIGRSSTNIRENDWQRVCMDVREIWRDSVMSSWNAWFVCWWELRCVDVFLCYNS